VLGQRVRHARQRAGLTLSELGSRVGRAAPFLSQLENGKVEARVSLVGELAEALDCPALELLDPAPPSRRAALEIELARLGASEPVRALGLTPLRPSPRYTDALLEHVVALYRAVVRAAPGAGNADEALAGASAARRASARLRREQRDAGNHVEELERIASRLLRTAGYPGHGPVSDRVIAELAGRLGFRIARVRDVPPSARAVADLRRRVIYIAQRDDLRIRAARSTVLQTLGHFALGHREPPDVAAYLRQRVEANYFTAAVLAPEQPSVELLRGLHARRDLSIEDLKEAFYLSYEMAAHRFTNLATRHLGIPTHFLRADRDGTLTKAYENDGLPLPHDGHGAVEGERIPASWSTRAAWTSPDSLHLQVTDLPGCAFFCTTYIENESERLPYAITVGTTLRHGRRFRGFRDATRVDGRQHDPAADPDVAARFAGSVWAAAAERSHALSVLPPASRTFAPFPGVDLDDVYRFLDSLEKRP
jgi:predicted transcriptional regulator/transcriptional regulator with XRE-family HTH domain